MKKLALIIILTTSISCKTLSGTIVSKEQFKQERIINNLKDTHKEAYVKANTWMVDAFTNPESVIEFSDKESGTILGKYLIQGQYQAEFGVTVDSRIFAKIDIRVKDHAAKLTIIPISDINIHSPQEKQIIHDKINMLCINFEDYMKNESTNW